MPWTLRLGMESLNQSYMFPSSLSLHPPSPFLERWGVIPPTLQLHVDSAEEVEPSDHRLKPLKLGAKADPSSLS